MPRRLIVAAVILYALLVQALLVGLAPAAASAAGRDGAIGTILCGHESRGGSSDHAPGDAHACCLAACSAVLSAPNPTDAAVIVWPQRPVLRVAWLWQATPPGLHPATTRLRARGPPPV